MPNFSRPHPSTDGPAAKAIAESQQRLFDTTMQLAEWMSTRIDQEDNKLEELRRAGMGYYYERRMEERLELMGNPKKRGRHAKERLEELNKRIKETEKDVLLALGKPEDADFKKEVDSFTDDVVKENDRVAAMIRSLMLTF